MPRRGKGEKVLWWTVTWFYVNSKVDLWTWKTWYCSLDNSCGKTCITCSDETFMLAVVLTWLTL
jgi:hypothetical protein